MHLLHLSSSMTELHSKASSLLSSDLPDMFIRRGNDPCSVLPRHVTRWTRPVRVQAVNPGFLSRPSASSRLVPAPPASGHSRSAKASCHHHCEPPEPSLLLRLAVSGTAEMLPTPQGYGCPTSATCRLTVHCSGRHLTFPRPAHPPPEPHHLSLGR